ncbi:MAG: Crp/Fnr family transcriptional regulator [Bacteroidia bacterium]|nr:Crp/Fnr family transcriptional regulator [Bacteroidia bacterium]
MKEAQIRVLLKQLHPSLSDEDLDILISLGKIQNFKNKDLIIREGDPATYMYFIAQGMIRGYKTDDKGDQKTLILRPTNTFFAAPGILKDLMISEYSFESIKSTSLFKMPMDAFIHLSKERIGIAQLYIDLLSENLRTVFFRVELLAGMSPEERYEALLKARPELFEKSFYKHVANYLGMTPTSLSRIIKRTKGMES